MFFQIGWPTSFDIELSQTYTFVSLFSHLSCMFHNTQDIRVGYQIHHREDESQSFQYI